MAGRSKKGLKVLAWIAAIPVLLFGAGKVVIWQQQRDLDKKIADARAAGFPIDAAMMDAYFPEPQGENAGPIYLHFKDELGKYVFTDFKHGMDLATSPTSLIKTEEDWKVLETFFREADGAMKGLERASKMPVCYYSHDWDKGFDLLLPEFTELKLCVKICTARYRLRVHGGDIDSALADLQTASRICAHVRTQPFLIGLLVSRATDAIVMRAVSDTLSSAQRHPALGAMAIQVVESIPESTDLTLAVVPEAFWQYWAADALSRGGSVVHDILGQSGYNSVEEHVAQTVLSQPLAHRPIKAAVLDVWMPVFESEGWADDRVFDVLSGHVRKKSAEATVYKVYFDVVSPMYEGLESSTNTLRANRRCLLAAFEVLESKSKQGTFPAALDKKWVDPFDNKPLRYKAEENGFRVWSVGTNLTDENGTPRQSSKQNDEVVIFPSPN